MLNILTEISMILMFLGFIFAVILLYILFSVLIYKIKKFMKRQSKIRCLCQHEYEQMHALRIGNADYKECKFVCRKCGKELKANIVV